MLPICQSLARSSTSTPWLRCRNALLFLRTTRTLRGTVPRLCALGGLAYALVTGCVPYAGNHYTKVLDHHLNAASVPMRRGAPVGVVFLLSGAVLAQTLGWS